jgi:hypothetical protein
MPVVQLRVNNGEEDQYKKEKPTHNWANEPLQRRTPACEIASKYTDSFPLQSSLAFPVDSTMSATFTPDITTVIRPVALRTQRIVGGSP